MIHPEDNSVTSCGADENPLVRRAEDFARKLFENDTSGHDFAHTERVTHLARQIQSKEGGNLMTVILAALLHDVDDPKLFPARQASPQTSGQSTDLPHARSFLRENDVSPEMTEHICGIIHQVSFKGSDTVTPDTLEGCIVQDADRLDAIGAIGIARAFAYGGSRHRVIYDPAIDPRTPSDTRPLDRMNEAQYRNNTGSTIAHFYDKLLLLKDLMNTKTAKEMAEPRDRYLRDFLAKFLEEWWQGATLPTR